MKNLEVVLQRASGDQAVDRRPNGETLPPGAPVQRNGFEEGPRAKRRLDDRQGEHCLAREPVGPFVAETVQYLKE